MGEVGKIGRAWPSLMLNLKLNSNYGYIKENEITKLNCAEKAGVTPNRKVSHSSRKTSMLFKTRIKPKPAAAKGTYFKSVAVTTTLWPGVRVNTAEFK